MKQDKRAIQIKILLAEILTWAALIEYQFERKIRGLKRGRALEDKIRRCRPKDKKS